MSSEHEYALWLCWGLLTLTDAALKNPVHDMLFPTEDVMENLLSTVTFAPGLIESLDSATPPTITFFKSLPTTPNGLWGVYLIVLEKPGCRPQIYIGCGTDSVRGLYNRFGHYTPEGSRLPKLVLKAMTDGYRITHKGILCWASIPDSKKRFLLRSLFIILETVFSLALWAMESRTKSYGMPKFLSWPVDTLMYDGCCTHNAIHEVVAGEIEGLNADQIALKQAEADVRRKEQEKRSRQKYYARRNAEDYEGWRLKKNAGLKKSDAKIKASGKYRCRPCKLNFKSQFALNRHTSRDSHISKTTGGKVYKAPGQKRRAEVLKASKKHYCDICDTAFASESALEKHYNGPRHIKRAAEAGS